MGRKRERRARKAALAAGAFASAIAAPSAAHASDDMPRWFVSPGVVWSWGQYPGGAIGKGVEVSGGYARLSGGDSFFHLFHVGGVVRSQWYDGDAGSFRRDTFAIEGGFPFVGLELGYAMRGAAGAYAASSGPHAAPYLSIGVFYVGPQFLFTSDRPEVAFNMGIKLPLPHSILVPIGIANGSLTGSGRPLRVAGEARVAPTKDGRAWRSRDAIARARANRKLAAHWLREARLEHASIAAFAKLSLALLAHAAPPDLVARAHEAALDEIRHARVAFALAERFGARAVDPDALDTSGAGGATPSLAEIAVESFCDGCIGEGIAAAAARRASRDAHTRDERRIHAGIARDEARHADLAWRVVAFCRARGGAEVTRALRVSCDAARASVEHAPRGTPRTITRRACARLDLLMEET
jgi:hypothetical protein